MSCEEVEQMPAATYPLIQSSLSNGFLTPDSGTHGHLPSDYVEYDHKTDAGSVTNGSDTASSNSHASSGSMKKTRHSSSSSGNPHSRRHHNNKPVSLGATEFTLNVNGSDAIGDPLTADCGGSAAHHGFYTMTVPGNACQFLPMMELYPNVHYTTATGHHNGYGNGHGHHNVHSNYSGTTSSGSHQQNHRFSPSPIQSRGSSPLHFNSGPGVAGPSPPVGHNAIYVHVNPGETLSVRVGNEIQHIPGPATVRMVSSNPGLPTPLPLQVPPGHTVQQIVDEHGVLRHVILSPQPPPSAPCNASGGSPSFVQQPSQYSSGSLLNGPLGSSLSFIPPAVPPSTSNGYGGHLSPSPPISHSYAAGNAAYTHPSPTSPSNQFGSAVGLPSLLLCSDNSNYRFDPRSLEARQRLQQKLRNRFRNKDIRVNCINSDNEPVPNQDIIDDPSANEDEETNKLLELLSKISPPQISDIRAREARLLWQPVDCSEAASGPFPEIEASDFTYDIFVAEKIADGKYWPIRCYASTEWRLCQLKPATEYFVKLRASLCELGLEGSLTDPVGFCTKPTIPDAPQVPRLQSKTKNTITLKWNSTCENGSRIIAYHLESDEGRGDNNFTEVYSGLSKSFRVTKLQPASTFRFRLAASNQYGRSEYSQIVQQQTSGQAPSAPLPPQLLDAGPYLLKLAWQKRAEDEVFVLQCDEGKGYGFMTVYSGRELQYSCRSLERNKEYRFRLSATNDDGESVFSDVVSFRTLPARPCSPGKPYLKGRIHSSSLKIAWDSPKDSGGGEVQTYQLEMCESAVTNPGHSGAGGSSNNDWAVVYSGSEREYSQTGLLPGTTYLFRVACTSSGGQSGYSESLTVMTLPVPPGQLSAPHLPSKPKPNSIHLQWNRPDQTGGSEITDYEVLMQLPDCVQTRTASHGLKTECTVGNLLPGRTYVYRVRAYNKAGAGPWSEAVEALTASGAPDAPSNLRIMTRASHTVFIQWDAPCANGAQITEYKLQYAQRKVVNAELSVQAISNLSNTIEPDLAAAIAELPSAAAASANSSQSTSVHSSPVHSRIGTVALADGLTGSSTEFGEFALAYSGPQCSYELRGLRPSAEYAIRVQAVNAAGLSKFSAISTCQTPAAAPGIVPDVQAEAFSTTEIMVQWERPDDHGSQITCYLIDINPVSERLQPLPIEVGADCQNFTFQDLTAETNYRIRVQAVNDIGAGAFSAAVKVQTFSRPPPPPSLDCVAASHNTLKLRWTNNHQTSEQLSYCVEMENKSGAWSPVYEGPSHLHKVPRLHECSPYLFRIRACSQTGGVGPWSQSACFSTTRAPPPPIKSAPKLIDAGPGTWQVEWSPQRVQLGSGEKILYQLQLMRPGLSSVEDYKPIYQGPSTSYTLSGLASSGIYRLRVALVRVAQDGEEIVGPSSAYASINHSAHGSQVLRRLSVTDSHAIGRGDSLDASADCIDSSGTSLDASQGSLRRELTDQQRALIILLVCSAIVLLLAFLAPSFITAAQHHNSGR